LNEEKDEVKDGKGGGAQAELGGGTSLGHECGVLGSAGSAILLSGERRPMERAGDERSQVRVHVFQFNCARRQRTFEKRGYDCDNARAGKTDDTINKM
jgi:hypothetical protein